jgi:hypothetical protein
MKKGANQKCRIGLSSKDGLKKYAIAILKAEAEHDKKMDKLAKADFPADKLRVDLLDIVLDMLGVPADNTVEMRQAFGQEAYDRPDCICRDCFGSRWSETEKTEKGIREFVDWVIQMAEFPARN